MTFNRISRDYGSRPNGSLEQFRWIAIHSYRTIELAISNEHERADSFYFYVACVGLIDEDDIVSKDARTRCMCVFFVHAQRMFSSVHTRLFMLSFIIIKRRYEKNNNRIRIVYDIEWVHFNFLNPIIYFFITRQNIFKTLKFYLFFLYFLYL